VVGESVSEKVTIKNKCAQVAAAFFLCALLSQKEKKRESSQPHTTMLSKLAFNTLPLEFSTVVLGSNVSEDT